MNIKLFIAGLLTTVFGIVSTISLWKDAKKEFKKEELKIIFWTLMFSTTISFACAGLDIMFFE